MEENNQHITTYHYSFGISLLDISVGNTYGFGVLSVNYKEKISRALLGFQKYNHQRKSGGYIKIVELFILFVKIPILYKYQWPK